MSDAVYISKLTGPEIDAALAKAAQALPMSGGTMTGTLNMGGEKITGLANPTADSDGVNKAYVHSNFVARGHLDGYYEIAGNTQLDDTLLTIIESLPSLKQWRGVIAVTDSTAILPTDYWLFEISKIGEIAKIVAKNSFYTVYRSFDGASFGQWVWENPPLVLGQEYLLAESFNNKQVYIKAVSFGTLPNAGEISADLLDANCTVIDFKGFATGPNNIPIPGYDISYILKIPGNGQIWLGTTSDMSAYTAYFVFKYYKK